MTDLASVLKIATRMRGLGITRRQPRARLRRLMAEADRARDRKDWPEASRLYRQVLELDPLQYGMRIQLGHAYKEQGDLVRAGLCYEAARQLAPLDDDIHLQIGHLEKLKGNFGEAALAYRKASELNPENAAAVAEYAKLAAALEAPPAAANGSAVALPVLVNGSANSPIAAEPDDRGAGAEWRDRGDRARDARRWSEAAAAYQEYLATEPDDVAIWVQLGHALKEGGDHAGGEAAYRTALALAPEDADAHLHLGHVLKVQGRTAEAVEAYRRSFELRPLYKTWRELEALNCALHELATNLPPIAERAPEILLDISDLLVVLCVEPAVSGIQRVQLGIISAALADAQQSGVRFVIWRDKELWTLSERLLAAMVPDGTPSAPRLKERQQLIRQLRDDAEIYLPVHGDTVVATGVLYKTPDLVAQRERLKRAGVRLGAYFYDFIPLTHPEFCARILINDFCNEAAEALLHLDFILTISEHVAAETRRLLQQAGYPPVPVWAVPLAHSLGVPPAAPPGAAEHWTGATAALRNREYVLCVGTLSVHKNQSFLVQVWQLLVQEGYDPPVLVLAGSRSFGADEILGRLSWSRNLGGRVQVIERATDEELAVLYRNCLFTMFPSFVEGWGLPIGESLAFGKLCIASRLASMPEVGGDHVLYIDPHNVRACADLVRDLLDNRSKLAAYERRIRTEFRPRQWDDHARAFLAAVKETAAAAGSSAPPVLGKVEPGAVLLPRRVGRPDQTAQWRFGTSLPAHPVFAEAVRGRTILARGWHSAESWGAWMAGRSAQLVFGTTLPPGSPVTVVLQFRAVPWSRGNVLRVASACGATVAVPVPQANTAEDHWRGQRYPELVFSVDCAVAADGSVDLLVELAGPLVQGWWGETRRLCVGLVRLAYLRAASAAVFQPANRRLRPMALTGPSGERAYPVGLRSMLAVLHGNHMLAAGWMPPDGSVSWMSGGSASVMLATEASPGEVVRVVLQLRTGRAPGGLELLLTAACGARTVWRLSGDSAAEWVWLECRVDADRRILLEIADSGFRAGAGGRVGLVSIAYGRCDNVEDRLALTEAMLYPASGDNGPSESAVRDDLRFTVTGHLKGSYSLAAINRSLALGLEAAYTGTVRLEQIETEPVRDLGGVPVSEIEPLSALAGRAPDLTGAEVGIVQHWPVLSPASTCDLPLALFVWEESLVPRDIVDRLNRDYRGVVTQTSAVRKVLLDSGVAVPVHMVGCAIDLSRFAAIAERRAAAGRRAAIGPSHPFVFLHVSSCFPRKGADLLLAAFAEAFRRDDPVRLVIKTFPNPHNNIAEQIEQLRASDPKAPEILLIEEDLEEAALVRLYEEADAMVLPTRGEGFNMPAAEAMAAGVPLIVTGHGGQADFAGPDVARLLDYRFAPSQSHLRMPGSLWVEPEHADLVAALRETAAKARNVDGVENPFGDQIERARRAIAPFGDRAAWGRRVADAAYRLITADPARYVAIGWVSTWKVRCGIAEYSQHLLSHFPGAARDVTVLCDSRTEIDRGAGREGPAARIGWGVHDDASMDELAAMIGAAGVDAVIVQHHRGYLRWAALARLLRDRRVTGRPVLVFIHNVRHLFEEEAASRADIVDALRLAARLLVHTVSDVNLLRSLGLVENVVLFPHGAEQARLKPPPVRSFAAGGAPLLGAYGFYLPPKGFDRLIRALPALRARWSGLRLRFVAAEHPAAESAEALVQGRQLAHSLGVADAIEWITDYLPNERSLELLNGCDLVVLPYRDTTESSSAAVRVAVASRAPVAVTPVRVFEDVAEAVMRLDGGESDQIASGIAAILDEDERRREIIEAAGRWLEEHDWSLIAARLHGMVAGLVATERTSR